MNIHPISDRALLDCFSKFQHVKIFSINGQKTTGHLNPLLKLNRSPLVSKILAQKRQRFKTQRAVCHAKPQRKTSNRSTYIFSNSGITTNQIYCQAKNIEHRQNYENYDSNGGKDQRCISAISYRNAMKVYKKRQVHDNFDNQCSNRRTQSTYKQQFCSVDQLKGLFVHPDFKNTKTQISEDTQINAREVSSKHRYSNINQRISSSIPPGKRKISNKRIVKKNPYDWTDESEFKGWELEGQFEQL